MNQRALLAIVPARGGSKGLPGKNARTLGDWPLLRWTVEAVRASGVTPDAFILSTDDDALATIGRASGLDVPFSRPAALANDTATALSVVEHALDWFEKERATSFDAVMWLQPTSPFREPSAITQAIELIRRDDVDAVLGTKLLHRSPSVLYYADDAQRLTPLASDLPQQTRRQDIRDLHTPNGALYVTKVSALRRTGSLYPPGTIAIPMNQIASLDIDDALDWALAEAVAIQGLSWRHKNC